MNLYRGVNNERFDKVVLYCTAFLNTKKSACINVQLIDLPPPLKMNGP